MGFLPENQVRTRLRAGGNRIRTLGPSASESAVRAAVVNPRVEAATLEIRRTLASEAFAWRRWLPSVRKRGPDIPSNPRRLTTDPCNKVARLDRCRLAGAERRDHGVPVEGAGGPQATHDRPGAPLPKGARADARRRAVGEAVGAGDRAIITHSVAAPASSPTSAKSSSCSGFRRLRCQV